MFVSGVVTLADDGDDEIFDLSCQDIVCAPWGMALVVSASSSRSGRWLIMMWMMT